LIQRVESSEILCRSFQLVSKSHYLILVSRQATEEELSLAEEMWADSDSTSHSAGDSSDNEDSTRAVLSDEEIGPRGLKAQYAIRVCRIEDNLTIATYHLPFFPETRTWGRPFVFSPTDKATTPGDDSFLPSEAPFRGPPEPKLYFVSFGFKIDGVWGSGTTFSFVTLIPSLISESVVGSGTNCVFPWSEWGYEKAWCFAKPGTGRYAHESISGYRVLTPNSLCDFNPLDVLRDRCREEPICQIYCNLGVLDQCEMVNSPVMHGRMPYREVGHNIPTNEMLTRIDEHSITGLKNAFRSHFFL